MAKKSSDMLTTKKAELDAYIAQFNTAVSAVSNAINDLDRINSVISGKITEIEEYHNELLKTKDGLIQAKNKNAKVISNLSALLNVD